MTRPSVIEVGIAGPQYDLQPVAFGVSTGVFSPTIPAPNNATTVLPIGVGMRNFGTNVQNRDPEGWAAAGADYSLLGSDPNNTWAQDWSPGDAIMLPPGVYLASWAVRFTTAPEWSENPMKHMHPWLDQAEWDAVNWPPSSYNLNPGPWFWKEYVNPFASEQTPARFFGATSPSTYSLMRGFFVNDTDESQPVIMALFPAGQSITRQIDLYTVTIVRIR